MVREDELREINEHMAPLDQVGRRAPTQAPRLALDVAKYFVEYSGYTKTNLQVQKLTYISHGYMLGIRGVPLVSDVAEAWEHGPVFPAVYREFKRWGSGVIGRLRDAPRPFTGPQRWVLDNVFASYGRFCGYFLSDITHSNSDMETPWQTCYVPGARGVQIDDEITRRYYSRLYERQGFDY